MIEWAIMRVGVCDSSKAMALCGSVDNGGASFVIFDRSVA